ncbi:hypothetical protein, partial [Corynebacterium phocae]|uniref:hypothetical protein n=1 Tax=Corynebacterium phocae TaxID=161895 RepID=UPI001B87AD46
LSTKSLLRKRRKGREKPKPNKIKNKPTQTLTKNAKHYTPGLYLSKNYYIKKKYTHHQSDEDKQWQAKLPQPKNCNELRLILV